MIVIIAFYLKSCAYLDKVRREKVTQEFIYIQEWLSIKKFLKPESNFVYIKGENSDGC